MQYRQKITRWQKSLNTVELRQFRNISRPWVETFIRLSDFSGGGVLNFRTGISRIKHSYLYTFVIFSPVRRENIKFDFLLPVCFCSSKKINLSLLVLFLQDFLDVLAVSSVMVDAVRPWCSSTEELHVKSWNQFSWGWSGYNTQTMSLQYNSVHVLGETYMLRMQTLNVPWP